MLFNLNILFHVMLLVAIKALLLILVKCSIGRHLEVL